MKRGMGGHQPHVARVRQALPEGFGRVQGLLEVPEQLSLFRQALGDVLAEQGIAPEEYRRWRSLGWLPDNPPAGDSMAFDDPRRARLALLTDMARSGLPDHVITGLLQGLALGADPARVAYSFRHGWVEAMPAAKDEAEDDEASSQELEERLEEIADRLKDSGSD